MYKLGVISQEWLKIEAKLLLSANRKAYMPRILAQQRMTFSHLGWLSSVHAKINVIRIARYFAVAELLVVNLSVKF